MPKFAANLTLMFTEVPFPERFARAANAGFRAVEFQFPYEHKATDIATWLNDNELECVLFNMPPGDWAAGDRGLACLPDRQKEFRDGVSVAMEYAAILKVPRLHALAGCPPKDVSPERARAVYVENLRYAAQRLKERELTLLIEPINPRDIPGYFLNRQDVAHDIREDVGASNLKVMMDFYHAQIVEGDLSMTYTKFAAHVGHIQIAGVPGRHEPDIGEINYAHLFTLLDDTGYGGWIGCEYRPRAATEDGLGWARDFLGKR
jgi:hydroxypyruvate isomerase